MKRIYSLISIVAVMMIVLFANISFAVTDEELAELIADKVLNKAKVGTQIDTTGLNVGPTDSLDSSDHPPLEIPIVAISDGDIQEAIDDTEGTDNKNINVEITPIGTIKVEVNGKKYEKFIALGSDNGNAQLSDQFLIANDKVWEVSTALVDNGSDSEYAKKMYEMYGTLDSNEKIHFVTFAQAKFNLQEVYQEDVSLQSQISGIRKLYLVDNVEHPDDVLEGKVEMNSVATIHVSGRRAEIVDSSVAPPIEQTKIVVDLNDSVPSKKGENIDNVATGNSEENVFSLTINNEGTYVLVLRDSAGNIIDSSDYTIYDKRTNKEITLQSFTGNSKTVPLFAGDYYVVVPSNQKYKLDISYAGQVTNDSDEVDDIGEKYEAENNIEEVPEAEFYEIVLSWFVLRMGEILNGLISIIAGEDVSIDAIVFDQYSRTTLNIFSGDSSYYTKENELLAGTKAPLNTVFSLFRTIALVCYMIILVYMGIRVILMATADKKAKYKEILFDWVKGIAIIFFFPYIIRYTILLNHGFVTYIYDNTGSIFEEKSGVIQSTDGGISGASSVAVTTSSNYMTEMYKKACQTHGLAYSMCWFIMLIQVIQFLIVYLKRLITVIFLIAIFPLVAISYAIDKIGDGKSQAFGHWCKEFVLQVFIQSFHAINYVLVMGIVFNLPKENWFLTIVGITYVAKGGDILKGLFAQMSGGAGKDGGVLSVAKALIQTKVAIGAVQSLKKAASATVGANSLMGRGVSTLVDAHDIRLQRKSVRTEKNTIQTLKNNGMLISITPDGLKRNLTDDEIRNHITNIFGGSMSDKDFEKAVEELTNVTPEKLNEIIKGLPDGLRPLSGDRKELDRLLGHAAALSVINNSRGVSNVTVQRAIDVVFTDRAKHVANSKNSVLDKYIEATKHRVSDEKLKTVGAKHSITIDEDKIRERKAQGPERIPTDKKERLRYALNEVSTAYEGGRDIEELHTYKDIIKEAKQDAELNEIVKKRFEKMNFTFEDFEANLHVQTINQSHRAVVKNSAREEKLLNDSIRFVKDAKQNHKHTAILNELNAEIERLKEGYIPELRNREKERQSKLEKEISKKIAEIDNPYLIDKGDEYLDYLDSQDAEFTNRLKEKAVKGTVMTITGAGSAWLKTGVAVASAGAATGMSMQGKSDPVDELLNVVPSTMAMSTEAIGKVGKTISAPVKKVADSYGDGVKLNTSRQALETNRKYYAEQVKQNAVNMGASTAEAERQRVLNRLNKRINDDSKKK